MYTDPAATYRIDGIEQMVENIPARYKDILAFLKIQEGGVLHHNAGEADITNGYGIYKYAWPNAEIWKYIRSVGMIQGLPSETKSWSDAACRNVVTPKIDPKYDLWLSYKFYTEYFKNIDMDCFTRTLIPVVVSLYTNSQSLFKKSLQNGINATIYNLGLKIPQITVDGILGRATYEALRSILGSGAKDVDEILKARILDAADQWYDNLYKSNPDKYGKYIKGWHNRVAQVRKVKF